jgi:hypothetical protein
MTARTVLEGSQWVSSGAPALTPRHDGHYDPNGYPVTPEGRPDWCARCSKVEREAVKTSRAWRPNRVHRSQREEIVGEHRSIVTTVHGLCRECGDLEESTRARLREAIGAPTKKAGGWR